MLQQSHHKFFLAGLLLGVVFVCVSSANAYHGTWLDQVTQYVLMQQAINTDGNFEPYLDQLRHMRNAVSDGDSIAITQKMTQFMQMLEGQAGGISKQTAEDIWVYCYEVVPTEMHTTHDQIKALGQVAFDQLTAREELQEWNAVHAF